MNPTAPVLKAIWQTLTTDAGVNALIGIRVFPGIVPQASPLPAVTYNVAASTRQPTFDGADSLPMRRIQFDAWAMNEPDAVTVADAVCKALDGLQTTIAGIFIAGAFATNEWQGYEDSPGVYRYSRDFHVWARDA